MEIQTPSTGRYRWTVCALLFFATTINYVDRQVIGLLKPVLESEFSWTELDYAAIVMAFSASYALGYLIFGRIVDNIGTKLGYIVSVFFWSLAAMLHAVVSSTFGFGAARAFLGISEAGNFPTAIKATAEWFPKSERALATGIFNSGTSLGPVIAPILVPLILGAFGWKHAFLWTGALGFLWIIFWIWLYEIPAKHKKLSKAEFNYIHQDEGADEPTKPGVSWIKLLRYRQTWVFVLGKLLTDPIWWFFLFWLPSYFSSVYNIDLKKPNLQLVVVYAATTIGSIGGGYLSSYLIRKGWITFRARKFAMLVFACCVIPVSLAQFSRNVWVAVLLISLAAAAHQAWSANIFTTVSDMFPRQVVSSVVGIGGMAGSVGGILFPYIVGQMLDFYKASGNVAMGYNLLFTLCGCIYVLAWLVMHLLSPRMDKVNL